MPTEDPLGYGEAAMGRAGVEQVVGAFHWWEWPGKGLQRSHSLVWGKYQLLSQHLLALQRAAGEPARMQINANRQLLAPSVTWWGNPLPYSKGAAGQGCGGGESTLYT